MGILGYGGDRNGEPAGVDILENPGERAPYVVQPGWGEPGGLEARNAELG